MRFIVVVGGSNPLKGDMLVIAGSTLYAISNVSEVREFTLFFFHSVLEYLVHGFHVNFFALRKRMSLILLAVGWRKIFPEHNPLRNVCNNVYIKLFNNFLRILAFQMVMQISINAEAECKLGAYADGES